RPFLNLFDFCSRVDSRAVNKKAIEALIKCGALGSTGAARKGMLMMLEQAQGAGQKAQQDAMIGQSSIFDLGIDDAAGGRGDGGGFVTPSHAPIPAVEFDRAELLAAEKESIGLFISAHPLKEVRAALRVRVDCPLADLADRRDGDWVLVGGMITETKKIRTKKGDPMMFATLDDLEGSVELLVFGNALAAAGEVLAPDSIVLVRGRVDHKDREKTCIVVQQIEPFRPSAEEVSEAEAQEARQVATPSALRLRLDATALAASVLGELKDVLADFPGDCEVVIDLSTSIGERRLKLGPEFRVAHSASLHAELDRLLGHAILAGGDLEAENVSVESERRRAGAAALT
ncbi:MAG TPA: OB-fold nucleic acid binding domain-containing protein, partial [Solirubrobacteraceae bacterium]|nr:OB-fold nucleic acid binding domain-containing protein [Solirubrobacteraceae bacterium]